MSDRVRYYLESSVKEVQDLKARGIFDQAELTKIMKRRSEYEHRLLTRTVKPEDFLAYAKYEMQVDRLRQLRVKRLRLGGKKSVSDWAGQRRIVFTLERGTKRFPANLKLWITLVDYAHKQHSVNVVSRALAAMLRLHPTDPGVWVYVAKFQVEENASVPEARAVLQRGLRFNADSLFLWLEYMRLELVYIAKILARRKLLGIERARKEEIDENKTKDDNAEEELTAADLAEATAELKALPAVNVEILGDPDSNPALRGDVALAVYDAAMGKFATVPGKQKELAAGALALFDEFTSLNRTYLCSHVIDSLRGAEHGNDDEIEFWSISLPIRHQDATDAAFPDSLRQLFNLYAKSSKSLALKDRVRSLLAQKVLEPKDVDENLRRAVQLFEAKM